MSAANGVNIHYEYHIIEIAFYLYVSLSTITLTILHASSWGVHLHPLATPMQGRPSAPVIHRFTTSRVIIIIIIILNAS